MRAFFVFLCVLSVGAGVGLSYGTELFRAQTQAFAARVEAARTLSRLDGVRAAARPLTLIFVGDIMLSRAVGRQITAADDPRYPFLLSAETLRAADLTFGNLEGTISGRGKDQGSDYSFRAEPRAVRGLVFAGFDALSLANNHAWDWGEEALLDTVRILGENGIAAAGAGANYALANAPRILVARGVRIAFLAYTDLMPPWVEARGEHPGLSALGRAPEVIAEARSNADIIVVSLHWGEEYQPHANEVQRELAQEFFSAGADLIVGHHPHVPQELRKEAGGWVAYSLGNFVFDQYFSEATMSGAALKVTVEGKAIVSAELVPFTMTETFQPDLVQ